ncbi:MAG: hypothetical protein ABSB15_18825 [Bryobacteraceae bacterium]|jgi:hypothetical protein
MTIDIRPKWLDGNKAAIGEKINGFLQRSLAARISPRLPGC